MMASYIQSLANEIRDELSDQHLDQPGIKDLLLLYALLAIIRGEDVTRKDVHDAWSTWTTMRDEDHESAVPFRELPVDIQNEDDPYVTAIRAVATRHLASA